MIKYMNGIALFSFAASKRLLMSHNGEQSVKKKCFRKIIGTVVKMHSDFVIYAFRTNISFTGTAISTRMSHDKRQLGTITQINLGLPLIRIYGDPKLF